MTQKVNGHNLQGSWFERDTSILRVTAAGGVPFSMPITVREADDLGSGTSERVMNVIQTRATVIGYSIESDTIANFMCGHAAGSWGELTVPLNGTLVGPDPAAPPTGVQPDVITELEALLDSLGVPTYTIEVFTGFTGAAPLAETTVQPDPPFTP